jgi:guanylate kinase
MKQIITITGPSGSGKTSIVNAAQVFYNNVMKDLPIPEDIPQVQKEALKLVIESGLKSKVKPVGDIPVCGEAISHTTRKPRVGEIEDVTYHYVTDDVIQAIDKLEETYYDGIHYCLSKKAIGETNAQIVLAVVDQNGAHSIKNNAPGTINVFLEMYPTQMRGRLELREDSEEAIIRRIKHAEDCHEYVFPDADVRLDSTGSLGLVLMAFIELIEKFR